MTTTGETFAQENHEFERITGPRLWIRRFATFLLPLIVIAGAIIGVMVMSALKPEPEEKEEEVKALPVLTTEAVFDSITLGVTAQGEVQPRSQINLVPQVSGKLSFVSPKLLEGERFSKGDLLVRIETEEYELRIVQAKAAVAQAETTVMREKSESEIALQDWEELGGDGLPSALTLREPQMAEAAAQLDAAKAQLGEAELQLTRTAVYAPFSGRVVSRQVNQGAYVTIGQNLGEIYSSDIMDVRLPLTNQDLARAGLTLGFSAPSGQGIPVTLRADVAGTLASWQGEIRRTDSRFDPETRVLFAYAEVRNPFNQKTGNAPLAPGIFVDAEIKGQDVDSAIVIPRAGLRGDDQIYIVKEDATLEIRSVSVRATDRDRAIISAGLSIGERVVISPIRGAANGMSVDVVDPLETGVSE